MFTLLFFVTEKLNVCFIGVNDIDHRQLINIISETDQFQSIPVRDEAALLLQVAEEVGIKICDSKLSNPDVKTELLIHVSYR